MKEGVTHESQESVTREYLQVGLGKPFKYVVTCVIMQRKLNPKT